MRFDPLTGLEPETDDDHARLGEQYILFLSGLGRSCVVFLVAWAVVFSLPSTLSADFGAPLTVIMLGATVWSIYPLVDGVWGLVGMAREARLE